MVCVLLKYFLVFYFWVLSLVGDAGYRLLPSGRYTGIAGSLFQASFSKTQNKKFKTQNFPSRIDAWNPLRYSIVSLTGRLPLHKMTKIFCLQNASLS
jgi:hypothetical protein